MKKFYLTLCFIVLLALLAACGNKDAADDTETMEEEELHELLVDFEPPETADVDEPVELKATVTYGDEDVTDGEVVFEYWEQGNEDDSTSVDAENNEDGTYATEVAFDHDGVFEIYAHTDAKELHTMPKRAVAVGDSELDENDDGDDDDHHNHHDEDHEHEHHHNE